MATYQTETKDKISNALWKLIEKNTLESITILMISQEARISRRSFYRHFSNKLEVLEYGLKRKRDKYNALHAEAQTMVEMIRLSFQFFKGHKKHLRLLQQNDLFLVLRQSMRSSDIFDSVLDIYMERTKMPASLREYVANVITATHTSLLMTWAENGFKENWRDLSRFELSMFSVMNI